MDNKHFEIRIEGLKYGKVRKELKNIDYKTAVSNYIETQKKFKKVKCEVILNEVNVEDNGKKTRKLQYRNMLGNNFSIEEKINQIFELIEELTKIKEYHNEMSYTGTSDFNDIRHAIELGEANDLTPEQCKNVFTNISEKAAIRRASLLELEKYKACSSALNNIKCQLNKCVDECKKIEKNKNTAKAKQNAEIYDKKYIDKLMSLCGGE